DVIGRPWGRRAHEQPTEFGVCFEPGSESDRCGGTRPPHRFVSRARTLVDFPRPYSGEHRKLDHHPQLRFSDAAEIFIFIFGYKAALVYGRSMRDHGFAIAAARILRRAWQVYAAHVFLFAVFAAEVMYVASAHDSPIFA